MRARVIAASALVLILVVAVSFVAFRLLATAPTETHTSEEDTEPPRMTILSPSDGSTVSGTVTIEFEAADNVAIDSLQILIDGSLRATDSIYIWDTTAESNGPHNILCRASDTSDNWAERGISVLINNTSSNPPVAGEAIKVMTYNIEQSGADPDWKQVMREENPDIVLLVETGTFDDNGNQTLNEIVNELNAFFPNETPYVGYCAQGISFWTDGEAILSRYPVDRFVQVSSVRLDNGSWYNLAHDFIDVTIDAEGVPLHVVGVHLKAQAGIENEWRRENETEGIINYLDDLGDVPLILMGDFNSFSPDDTGALAPKGDLGYGPLTMLLHPDDPVYGQWSSEVHQFTDAFRALNPDDPGYTYGHQDPSHKSRIDFLLVNQQIASHLINSTAGDTPSADTGSDHYPVDAFIQWGSENESDTTPPGRVVGVSVDEVTLNSIRLSWVPNTESDLWHYLVFRNGSLIGQPAEASFTDSGLSPATTYRYEVAAIDRDGNVGPHSDPVAETTLANYVADHVVINEFLPDPDTLYTEEWIELYNPLDSDVNLSGYMLDDIVGGGTAPYTIPQGTIISAHGFLVFYGNVTGVILNNSGDNVTLLMPDGVTVVDSHSYSSSSNDVSIGRTPDGGSTWTTFTTPTPGASNGGGGSFDIGCGLTDDRMVLADVRPAQLHARMIIREHGCGRDT